MIIEGIFQSELPKMFAAQKTSINYTNAFFEKSF